MAGLAIQPWKEYCHRHDLRYSELHLGIKYLMRCHRVELQVMRRDLSWPKDPWLSFLRDQISMTSGGFEKVGVLQRFLEGTFWNSCRCAWEVCESYHDACDITCGSQMVPSMELARVNLGRFLEFPFEETRSAGHEPVMHGKQVSLHVTVSAGVLRMKGEPKEDLGLQQGGYSIWLARYGSKSARESGRPRMVVERLHQAVSHVDLGGSRVDGITPGGIARGSWW
ncbi:hypothetical protein NE237_012933 [Protea cynaroides]|uniref:Uncharacterized protein n=1 Tax=Protea cynaroides TaxID=273540 RepID=A0A9Q0JZB3_9MAGN|nr:hypothetical protein NE237_012933 [Protea cynaroides]